ncbi:cytochrome c3 family protein [Alloalcanivorax marinus]|uniref:cytochrome c3 family protein n=1 Tax=Alloalcanivorax marinus TaxID=1177169 RepID=UPI0019324DE1|nr:cytochrome c3 family protein [Alloalcanivorax marinus]MBL7250531.1 cytochrome c3 family protein [Alloalcanivorax marinus]
MRQAQDRLGLRLVLLVALVGFAAGAAAQLDQHHALNDVPCQACHGAAEPPTAVATEQCLGCHGPLEDLGALTEKVSPTNPHSTPHGATFAECDLCHRVHGPSENFCAQCHDFKFTVP